MHSTSGFLALVGCKSRRVLGDIIERTTKEPAWLTPQVVSWQISMSRHRVPEHRLHWRRLS